MNTARLLISAMLLSLLFTTVALHFAVFWGTCVPSGLNHVVSSPCYASVLFGGSRPIGSPPYKLTLLPVTVWMS